MNEDSIIRGLGLTHEALEELKRTYEQQVVDATNNLKSAKTGISTAMAHQQQTAAQSFVNAINAQLYGNGTGNNTKRSAPMQPTGKSGKTMADEAKRIEVKPLTVKTAKAVLSKVLKTDIVPFMWGPPGVGKSSMVREICKENNWKLIDLRLSLLNPVDLRGLPVIDHEAKLADWFSPSFLPKYEEKEPGILFLDEINLAPLSVQAAAYQLILDKRVGEYRFPPTWKIIAAGNRETDRANVYKLSAPLANRFIHFTVDADYEEWIKWGKEHIREEVTNYLGVRPQHLLIMPIEAEKAFPSPRSWEFISKMLDAFDFDGDDVTDGLKQAIVGGIGDAVGREFIVFLQTINLKEVAETVRQFIATGLIKVPKESASRYAMCNQVLRAYEKGEIDGERMNTFKGYLTPEEAATIEQYLAKKKTRVTRVDDKLPTELSRSVDVKDMVIHLADPNIIDSKYLKIGTPMEYEVVEVKTWDVSGEVTLKNRGLNGTTAQKWLAGAQVNNFNP